MKDEDRIEELILKNGEKHQKILDVGCGDADLLIKIAERNESAELWCVDKHAEYARLNVKIKGYSSRIKCISAKAEDIPLEDRFFDFVYSIRSLHEFSDPVRSFKEFKRLLTQGGEMMIIDWKYGTKTIAFWERYYKMEELIEFARKAGYDFKDVKTDDVGRFNILSYKSRNSRNLII